jgi:hypothetical protein
MSLASVISLIVFLWLIAIWLLLRFMQFARPYREDSEEQRAEDREQERYLRAWSRLKRLRDKM